MLAAASCDSASTMVYPVTSFLTADTPDAVTRFVLPSGAPISASARSFVFIHVIQASMPAFLCSGVELAIICSIDATGAIYKTKNLLMSYLGELEKFALDRRCIIGA